MRLHDDARPARGGTPASPVERASATDRAFRAMDRGGVPEHFGVVLVLGEASEPDIGEIRRVVDERIRAVPRLRQRLVDVPFGCGGPIWGDDPGFDVADHVHEQVLPAGTDWHGFLDACVRIVATRLPAHAPMWSVTWLHGPLQPSVLVVTLHHTLADGMGGLAVLDALRDPGRPAVPGPFPRPLPSRRSLVDDAWRRGWRRTGRLPAYVRDVRASMSAGGGIRGRPIAPTSLLQPTGPRRSMAVVTVPVAAVAEAAHRRDATTNDLVLVATGQALDAVLARRGEAADPLVVTVPVSGRGVRTASSPLGNMVSPLLVDVPTTGALPDRLARVSAQVRTHKASAQGPPPLALLGPVFRVLAAMGGYDWFMRHQRRTHTLVTHVRGPRETVSFMGHPVTAALPISLGENGNIPVHFTVLSYAGMLSVAAIVDSEHFPELDLLSAALRESFATFGVGACGGDE